MAKICEIFDNFCDVEIYYTLTRTYQHEIKTVSLCSKTSVCLLSSCEGGRNALSLTCKNKILD